MARYYGDVRKSVALIGKALEARGWTLYGWSADKSDIMTDYFCPESWDGVATKGDAVACVDVNDYTVSSRSGGQKLSRPEPDAECPRCHGAQVDPAGWTYQKAKADPRGFNADAAGPNARSLFPDVVSPIPFFGIGPYGGEYPEGGFQHERCRKCSGSGHTFRSVEYVEPWPTFQANPPHRNWHVERGGQIVASGSGSGSCDAAKAEALADKIEAAAFPPTRNRTADTMRDATPPPLGVEVNESSTHPGNVEVRFASKPSDIVRAALKAAGFRWYGPASLWYGPAVMFPEWIAQVQP
jgi:hypothetical protein